jgi:hypothetical protein
MGTKWKWLPDDEHPGGGKWGMILRRNDNTIHAAHEEFWEKVWWNRHQNWLYRIKLAAHEPPLEVIPPKILLAVLSFDASCSVLCFF